MIIYVPSTTDCNRDEYGATLDSVKFYDVKFLFLSGVFAAANLEAAKAQNRRVDTSLKIVARPTSTNLSQFLKWIKC